MKLTDPYHLEIYMPGSFKDCWVAFSSPTPFMAINVGDIINPSIWEGSQSPMKVLRVINVEHIIWQVDGPSKHKICVYSEEIDHATFR